MACAEAREAATIRVLREADSLWRLEGGARLTRVGILAATEHLTVGKIYLLPGQHTDPRVHGGDESIYVLCGHPNVLLPEADGQRWFELKPSDGFYIPEGVLHQYYNMTGEPVEIIFGVAPYYAPKEEATDG
jgi:quercetin dioxygenase-like cupin family protein